jgi:hypothetical protein
MHTEKLTLPSYRFDCGAPTLLRGVGALGLPRGRALAAPNAPAPPRNVPPNAGWHR